MKKVACCQGIAYLGLILTLCVLALLSAIVYNIYIAREGNLSPMSREEPAGGSELRPSPINRAKAQEENLAESGRRQDEAIGAQQSPEEK